MSPDQKFTLLLTAMGVLFTMLSAIITLVWRNGNKAGSAAADLKSVAEDVKNIAADLDRHIQWHLNNRNRVR